MAQQPGCQGPRDSRACGSAEGALWGEKVHGGSRDKVSGRNWDCHDGRYLKNPAYGRHWISWPMRIVAPLPKRTEIVIFFGGGGTTF